jgi:nitrate reductase beta subunit
MVFHLDKCIGCHTCSIACKNIWTDRKGAEYMWWNNVETKPGTGYPDGWEDQEKYKGAGRKKEAGRNPPPVARASSGPGQHLPQPQPAHAGRLLRAVDLRLRPPLHAPEGDDQPTARAISLVTGKPMEIEAGPNWDDDLSGSPIYAENDPNLEELTDRSGRSSSRSSGWSSSTCRASATTA